MKYLIWILVILLAIWAFKRSRRVKSDAPKEQPPAPAPAPATPANMAVCLHCGIHLPQDEAVTGEKGLYCSAEHRAAAQDRNPV
jgi:uncharacterized protein